MIRLAALALLLAGCATSTEPYVRTYVLEPFRPYWFADGPPMVIEVGNRDTKPRDVDVRCQTEEGETGPWVVHLPAKTVTRVLGQVMNRFAYWSPCWVHRD